MGVARVVLSSAKGDQRGSILGGITVFGSIEHIKTTRTVHKWHIARFDDDNCVLDKRYFLHEYEN